MVKRKEQTKAICLICKTVFYYFPSQQSGKFCSKSCDYKYRKTKEYKEVKSEMAKKQMKREYELGIRDRFKITKKANEAWRKGPSNQNFRKRVFESKIPKACAICLGKENLVAHHIIPQEYNRTYSTGKGNHSLSNAQILCTKCHAIVHRVRSGSVSELLSFTLKWEKNKQKK